MPTRKNQLEKVKTEDAVSGSLGFQNSFYFPAYMF